MTVPGLTFGRYEILDTLGGGGFATVYRAWDPMLQREVALKVLLPHVAEVEDVRRRFLREAQTLARLRHPNIVNVFEIDDSGPQPYFTMELIRGQSLNSVIRPGEGLPLDKVLAIIEPLCSAIDYAHAAGLVHRDIKTSNIMQEPSGHLVLMDFGIARVLDQTQHTRIGASLGTPEAMAPEQVRGDPAGPEADIYALGILTYQLLAGRPPFIGDTAYVLHAHAYEPPPSLEEVRPGLSPAVYWAVAAALAKKPADRPATAGTFLAMLHGAAPVPEWAAAAPDLDPAGPPPQPAQPAQRRSNGRWVAAALLLGLAMAGLLFWAYARGGSGGPREASASDFSEFMDRFDDPDHGLLPKSASDGSNFRMTYGQGEYVIQKTNPNYPNSPEAVAIAVYIDSSAAVDVHLAGDTTQRYVSLGCRMTDSGDSGYKLWVNPHDGTFSLQRFDRGAAVRIRDWTRSSQIRRDNLVNHVELSCMGNTISAKINDRQVISVKEGTYREGRVTLSAGTSNLLAVEGRFQKLVIRGVLSDRQ